MLQWVRVGVLPHAQGKEGEESGETQLRCCCGCSAEAEAEAFVFRGRCLRLCFVRLPVWSILFLSGGVAFCRRSEVWRAAVGGRRWQGRRL